MGGWDVGVDVSNVCRDRRFGDPASATLDRLDRVIDAWRRDVAADARVHLVADDSLRWSLGAADQRRWDRMVSAGELVTAEVADEPLLEWAGTGGRHVLSRDQFLDHRRTHPWIDDHPERFHQWGIEGGEVTIEAGAVVAVASALVSLAVERKELKRSGLDPKDHWNILNTKWRCTTASCFHARMWPDHLLVWPSRDSRGAATCPGCGLRLDRIGRRDRTVQMVVDDHHQGTELLRFPLELGHPVVVGRGRGSGHEVIDITRGLDTARAGKVSRSHASLALRKGKGDPTVDVADLESLGGTVVRRDGRGTGVVPGDVATMGPGDRLELAGQLSVRLSGLRFVADDRLPPASGSNQIETIIE